MWPALIPLIGTILDKFLPDPKVAAEAKLQAMEMAQKGELAQLDADVKAMVGQLEINKQEAASTSWFVAGWRPFIGWICGLGLGYVAIVEPLARFVAQVWFGYKGPFPVIDTSLTMQVMLGLLGLGAMRSVEKVKGAEGNR